MRRFLICELIYVYHASPYVFVLSVSLSFRCTFGSIETSVLVSSSAWCQPKKKSEAFFGAGSKRIRQGPTIRKTIKKLSVSQRGDFGLQRERPRIPDYRASGLVQTRISKVLFLAVLIGANRTIQMFKKQD